MMTSETITVPNLNSHQLLALAEKKLELELEDRENFAKYDFMRDEQMKEYEVVTWQPERRPIIPSMDVRRYFRRKGFAGNVACLITWLLKTDPEGVFTTIPEKGRLFHWDDPCGSSDFVICYYREGDSRTLCLHNDPEDEFQWDGYPDWTFVAFREVKR